MKKERQHFQPKKFLRLVNSKMKVAWPYFVMGFAPYMSMKALQDFDEEHCSSGISAEGIKYLEERNGN